MAASVLEGAELVDVVAALDEMAVRDYCVIGGWCPYLQNTSSIAHPRYHKEDGNRSSSFRHSTAIITIDNNLNVTYLKGAVNMLHEVKV